MQIIGWVLFFLVFVWVVPATAALWFKQLRLTRDLPKHQFPELISVIIPARNEEVSVEKALTSVLKSESVSLEFIVINDRSTDTTGDIIDRLAATDPRVRAIHITELPDGWLGKNHAMHIAAGHASGTLLLFTDADVVYEPGAIHTAAEYLRSQELRHLCLLPRMLPGTLLENSAVAWFGLAFAFGTQLQFIRTRWSLSYAGVGAFNLIDADFYRSFGGHEPIALDVLDDVKLGKLVKRHHGRQDFQSASELLSIRWQPSLWGVITGLEKNGFAALNYSIMKVLLMTAVYLFLMIAPYVAVVLLPFPDKWGFLGTILVWHACYGTAAFLTGGGLILIPFFPVASTFMAFAFLRSAFITLRQGGVRWRDSFYPLSLLKPAIYR
ncbi:MAG: glycosyltransferase [Planctomyces sp.]